MNKLFIVLYVFSFSLVNCAQEPTFKEEIKEENKEEILNKIATDALNTYGKYFNGKLDLTMGESEVIEAAVYLNEPRRTLFVNIYDSEALNELYQQNGACAFQFIANLFYDIIKENQYPFEIIEIKSNINGNLELTQDYIVKEMEEDRSSYYAYANDALDLIKKGDFKSLSTNLKDDKNISKMFINEDSTTDETINYLQNLEKENGPIVYAVPYCGYFNNTISPPTSIEDKYFYRHYIIIYKLLYEKDFYNSYVIFEIAIPKKVGDEEAFYE